MTKLSECPFCGEDEDLAFSSKYSCIVCNCCGAQGPTAGDSVCSTDFWNEREDGDDY